MLTEDKRKSLMASIKSKLNVDEFLNSFCELVLPATTDTELYRQTKKHLGIGELEILPTYGLRILSTDGRFIILSSMSKNPSIYRLIEYPQLVEFEFKGKAYQFPLEVLKAVLVLERDHAAEWLKNLKRV